MNKNNTNFLNDRSHLTFVMWIAFSIAAFAQNKTEENRVIPPSPNAASLGKYGEYPVGHHTGVPNINVPLYQVTSGKLSIPISLNYHIQSVRPSEIPSWVGLGWSLNAGGVVTRVVKNLPDDTQIGGILGYYHGLSNFNSEFNSTTLTYNFVENVVKRNADGEADIFSFNVNGLSGTFFIGHDGQVHLQSKSDITINLLDSPSDPFTFGGWQIIGEDGVVYTFSAIEYSAIRLPPNDNEYLYPSSWYLSEILSPINGLIGFTYTNPSLVTRDVYQPFRKMSSCDPFLPALNYQNHQSHYGIFLQAIDFNNGKLVFENANRSDGTGDKKLTSIKLYDLNNNLQKQWSLQYANRNLLVLQSVQEFDANNNSIPPYLFTYNSQQFAVDGISTTGVDYWGYYNGESGLSSDFPLYLSAAVGHTYVKIMDPHPTNIFAETLQKITFPTGGYTQFEFEHNDFSSTFGPGPPSYKLVSLGGYSEYSYEPLCDASDLQCYYGAFSFDTETSVTFSTSTMLELEIICSDCDATNSTSYAHETKKWYYSVPSGTYLIDNLFENPIAGIKSTIDYSIDTRSVHFRYKAYKIIENPTIWEGGGLRIKNITSSAGMGSPDVVKSYSYRNGILSTGILNGFPWCMKIVDFDIYGTCTIYSSIPVVKLPYGPAVTYSFVKETLPDNSYITYEFTNHFGNSDSEGVSASDDGNSNPATGILPVPGNGIYIDESIARGLLVRKTSYNSSSIKMSETEISYDVTRVSQYNSLNFDIHSVSLPQVGLGTYSVPLLSKYWNKSSFVRKLYEINTEFMNGTVAFSNRIDYFYDNALHHQVTRSEQIGNDGKKRISRIYYPDDFTDQDGGSIISALKSGNFKSHIIQRNSIIDESGSQKVTSSAITIYDGIQPVEIATTGLGQPVAINSFPTYVPINGYDQSKYKTDVQFTYDQNHNVIQILKDGIKTSFVWGYNSEYPIAKIINAQWNQIFHTGFEDDVNAINGDAATGTKSKQDFSITLQNLIPGSYDLSYFKKVNGVWESFTQANINAGASYSISITGQVDEVRFFPSNSQITTYTYDPLAGMTSMTDPNGLRTFYKYDSFKRLKQIVNENGGVEKQYTYHYKNQ